MKLLIDSSSDYLFLGIVDDNNTYTFHRMGKCDHSETLMDNINNFLKDNNFTLSNVTEVIIGRGPGSYTGLRIAGTIGKTLAYLLDVPFKSFSSLDLILCGNLDNNGKYAICIPAKKNSSYVKFVEIKDKKIVSVSEEEFMDNCDIDEKSDYHVINMTEEFFKNSIKAIEELFSNNLIKDEDYFEYSPNYIRSVL